MPDCSAPESGTVLTSVVDCSAPRAAVAGSAAGAAIPIWSITAWTAATSALGSVLAPAESMLWGMTGAASWGVACPTTTAGLHCTPGDCVLFHDYSCSFDVEGFA